MKTFVWHNGKPQAMKKYNDDLIMSCAIGCWVRDIAFSVNQREIGYKRAFLDCMTKSNTQMNTTIPGMDGHKPVVDREKIAQQLEYIWLLKG